MCFLCVTLIKE